MNSRIFRVLTAALVALGLVSFASAQYVPGAQPVVYPTYQNSTTTATATNQFSTPLITTGLASGVIEVTVNNPATLYVVAAPAFVASAVSTYSTLTYTSQNTTDFLSGTLKFSYAGGATITVTIPWGSTLTQAAAAINANPTANAACPATVSTATIVLTGVAYGAGGIKNCVDQGSVLNDTLAVSVPWNIQGSVDGGVTWVQLPTAAMPTTAQPSTTAITQTTAVPVNWYLINFAGFNRLRFVTTGTFTGASAAFTVSAVPLKGEL
jgi:hypothetical protein